MIEFAPFFARPAGARLASRRVMRIEIVGDDSISRQARIYAEYRLFAVLSHGIGTRRVNTASIVLRRVTSRRQCEGVVATVTIELEGNDVARLTAWGEHPYAAINRAVERLRLKAWPVRRGA